MSVIHSAKTGDILGVVFLSFSNMKGCCVFSLESTHRGDSTENIQHTIINRKKERKSPEIMLLRPITLPYALLIGLYQFSDNCVRE